jgi:hypothetical protein
MLKVDQIRLEIKVDQSRVEFLLSFIDIVSLFLGAVVLNRQ